MAAAALDQGDAMEAVAQALADYRLRAIFPPTSGPSSRHDVVSETRFGDWAAAELVRAARDQAVRLAGWQIAPPLGVFTFDPDRLLIPPSTALVARNAPDLAFQPDARPAVLPSPAVRRVAIVHPDLLRRIAALFAAAAVVPRAA